MKEYRRPSTLISGAPNSFCPGCMHSMITKLISEVLDEMGQVDNAIEMMGIGCCGLRQNFVNLDQMFCAHGRACASATGAKRCRPDKLVFTYQGDGDLAAIGLAETMSAANRGENFTVIFVNNSTYGMTGGQMAPTTLLGMKATTAPYGRKAEEHGYPMHMVELLNQLEAPAYLARVACNSPANIRKTKAAIKKAFTCQLEGKGFSLVEIMSNCPTNWGMSPSETLKFMEEKTLKEFPLGELRAR